MTTADKKLLKEQVQCGALRLIEELCQEIKNDLRVPENGPDVHYKLGEYHGSLNTLHEVINRMITYAKE